MNTCCSGETSCACGNAQRPVSGRWVKGEKETPAGKVALIETDLRLDDTLDCWKARWGIGRMDLKVVPGLYAAGNPSGESPVLVTANYKPSFDSLRGNLKDLDAWILVLDTKGVNVWCAAGKGTFGTEELVRRIEGVKLREIVTHRQIILPQLGASGVAGQFVKVMTGFKVVFGPVSTRDLKDFINNGMQATAVMRTVRFDLFDRLAVVPVELVRAMKYFLLLLVCIAIWKWIFGNFSIQGIASSSLPLLGAILIGTVGVPALLPWIPLRSFALKGYLLGLIWAAGAGWYFQWGMAVLLGNVLLLPVVSAFLSLNFTGCTTFTSQNGVNREIALYARPMAVSGLLGCILIVACMVMGVFA